MSPSSAALKCMQSIQEQCYELGIPLRTRHKEVAPGQYEFSPLFGTVTEQVDQNIMVMQIIEETAREHGLAALLQEKPFAGVNGSGKHNNWSLMTSSTGLPLLDAEAVIEKTGRADVFLVVLERVLSAVHAHADLLRMTVAGAPGNDFRLGACEAPPAIISAHLGDALTAMLRAFADDTATAVSHQPRAIESLISSYRNVKERKSFGAHCVPDAMVYDHVLIEIM